MQIDFSHHFASTGGIPFPHRQATMPWRQQTPLPASERQSSWQELLSHPLSSNKRLLYLHVPFCATRCTFCGFYQNPLDNTELEKYCQTVVQELATESRSPLHQTTPIQAIYLGGGTPTALSASQLSALIYAIRSNLPLTKDCEITVEGRILDFDDERIDACLEAGVNRFSLGIQTFDTRLRQRLGRRTDQQSMIDFISHLARYSKATIVGDLMFGLPGQTLASWEADLSIVRQLPMDGIDLYALNLFPSTPLAKGVEKGRQFLPTPEWCRNAYQISSDTLSANHWHQLSNSHWARTRKERNMYNLLIKSGADYLALGCSAGGSLDGTSYMNHRDLSSYYKQVHCGEKPLAMMTHRSTDYHWRMAIQGGLDTGRCDLAKILPAPAILAPLLVQWQSCGLLSDRTENSFTLSTEGRFWASNMLNSLQQLIPVILQAAA
ncbi:heme anaerobic degradation radical SAM methyltransferase ChuW/HutW (plasmid) [Klebsiella sp. WOUb02]|uniref:heme anaerobic degradation radical SAM methyltransferase ChuW/HutW n=1 Tax=Klebsiella sp. WOUb02 TaxID=3161071 RepID=UPI003CFB13DC